MSIAENGILVFTFSTSTAFRSVLRGIIHAAQSHHWSVRVIDTSRTLAPIAEIIRECRPLAALTYYLDVADFPKGIPSVHINPVSASAKSWTVCHDSTETGRLAARELIRIGLEHFAFVGTPTPAKWSQTRQRVFAETLAKLGSDCLTPEPHIRNCDPFADQCALCKWLKSLPRPCGIFTANDRLADLVVAAAKTARLAIPDDLAVIGADNDEQLCENAAVTISSIAPDFIRGGTLACELLASQLSQQTQPATLNFQPSTFNFLQYGDLGVIRRASTQRLQHPSAMVADMREFIRRRAASGISASDVIAGTKGSRRAAELVFRAATGHTIGQEIVQTRIDLALRHLADPTVRIGEIPGLVGYVSQNQLERVFRRATGLTMRDYRTRANNR